MCKQFYEIDRQQRGIVFRSAYEQLIAHKLGDNKFQESLPNFLEIADKDYKGYVTLSNYVQYRLETRSKI